MYFGISNISLHSDVITNNSLFGRSQADMVKEKSQEKITRSCAMSCYPRSSLNKKRGGQVVRCDALSLLLFHEPYNAIAWQQKAPTNPPKELPLGTEQRDMKFTQSDFGHMGINWLNMVGKWLITCVSVFGISAGHAIH